jgi:formylmethanofuran dehydrogenase subunit A
MMDNKEVHGWAAKKSALATLDREYDFYDIATITRAAPSKIYGFEDRGNLSVGSLADIAVYDLEPNNFDPTVNAAAVENAFSNALYTIKDGEILVKDGEVVKVVSSNHVHTEVQGFEDQEKRILEQIMPMFNKYYTVKFENYIVHDHYAEPSTVYKVNASK